MENWRVIPNTDGMLLVSDMGRIKSLLRDGRILKATADEKGYLRIRYTINRIKYIKKVHRLVAEAFISNPNHYDQVNHIDGDKKNNKASNLEWCTNIQNAEHAIKSGLWDNVFAASKRTNEKRKVPIIAKDIITGKAISFDCIADAERYIGTKHITDVLKGKRRQAKGYVFFRGVILWQSYGDRSLNR